MHGHSEGEAHEHSAEPTPAMPAPARWDAARFAELSDREDLSYQLAGISPRRRAFSAALTRGIGGAGEWLERHWLGVVNGVLGTYVGLAVATPIAYMFGLTGPASAVFRVYRVFCDQLPTHSLFIGGYQICLCARCLAIYTTMLLVGLTLNVVRRMRPRQPIAGISWWVWILAMLPMALDGGTQLFGLRESNLVLRLLTGFLFGLATALFTLPQMDAAVRFQTRLADARQGRRGRRNAELRGV
jgi:uncharacterized membrane protein